MAATQYTPSGVTGHGAHLPLRGFTTIWPPHRPSCENGAEAIRALAMQIPAFRQKLSDGWYQVRIAGRDAGETNYLPVLMSRWQMVP